MYYHELQMYFIAFYITSLYALIGKQNSKHQLSSFYILSHMGFSGFWGGLRVFLFVWVCLGFFEATSSSIVGPYCYL